MECICHYSTMQNIFIALKTLCTPHIYPSSTSASDNHWSCYYLNSFTFTKNVICGSCKLLLCRFFFFLIGFCHLIIHNYHSSMSFLFTFLLFYFWPCCIFLAMQGEQELLSSHGTQASCCGCFSRFSVQALWPLGFSIWGCVALECVAISSSGAWDLLPHGMWNLPRPGIEPVFPALASRFLTFVPPGKPHVFS